jgi:lipopolysaccharide/colanic/teichoic acid biosynthesis glycosyltransferase
VNTSSLGTEKNQVAVSRQTPLLDLFLKRGFDVFIACLGLLILWPLFLFVGIRLKRESPGPLFYRGPRMGRGGKVFQILKFRTMYESPESYLGPRITANGDERITPFGQWLRDSKINELPQLWNVLKGEMSMVGPRPEDPEIVNTWPEGLREEILSLRPGITSPASVIYRHEEKSLNAENVVNDYLINIVPDKLRLDLLYVRTHNFVSDIDILLWTSVAVFPNEKGKPIPENRLYSGPIFIFLRRYITWFSVDILVALLSTGIIGVIWRLSGPLDIGWSVAISLAVGIGLLFGIINGLLGLKKVSWRDASPVHLFDLAISSVITTGLILLIRQVWPTEHFLPPGMIVEIGLVAFLGFVAVRYRQRLFTGLASRWLILRGSKNSIGERVLIVGAGDCGQLAGWLLKKSNLASAFFVVGLVDDDPFKYGMFIDGHPVLGTTRDIPALVQQKNIGVILYAISKISPAEQERILRICCSQPVRVIVVPNLIQVIQEQFQQSYKGGT